MEDNDGITAYHGSPHDFEQFDIGKIGTGEGAQAFGHGLYFAQNEDVARGYRDRLAPQEGGLRFTESVPDELKNRLDSIHAEHGWQGLDSLYKSISSRSQAFSKQARDAWEKNWRENPEEAERLRNAGQKRAMELQDQLQFLHENEHRLGPRDGRMYEVSINAHPDHFLDWDKPLAEQPYVMSAIDQHLGDPSSVLEHLFGHQDATGRDFHEKLGGERKPQAVAQRLSDMGIKGIRYLDAGSRGADEKPTHNYVVFDDKLVNVRRKYKKGGAVEPEGGAVDTDHPNFRAWFGNSVTHDEGVPRRYYTGTSKDVDFKKFKVARHGAWFTTDPSEASSYAEENDSQNYKYEGGRYQKTNTASRVIPAYLKAENPYRGEKPDWLLQEQNYKKAQSDWFDTLRAQGHDSWIPDSMGGNLAVILGHPGQIKSALSNTGEYDPDKDIHRATGGRVNTNPTEAQKEAGNYRKGHVTFQGLDITIENPKGSSRKGVGQNGKPWSVTMPAHYGYIKRTEGADGDHVDVYLGPNEKSHRVFVVDQQDYKTKSFDEHKVMLGYNSKDAALDAYKKGFSDGRGADRVKHLTEMTVAEFKVWLKHGNTRKRVKSRTIVDRALAALSRKK